MDSDSSTAKRSVTGVKCHGSSEMNIINSHPRWVIKCCYHSDKAFLKKIFPPLDIQAETFLKTAQCEIASALS